MNTDAGASNPNPSKLPSPRQAIRAKCRECFGGDLEPIRNCTCRTPKGKCDPSGCWLWPYRMGHGIDPSREPYPPTRLQAIYKECLNCMGGDREGVKECPSDDCPLYPFRLGHNPNRAGIGPVRGRFKLVEARTTANMNFIPTPPPEGNSRDN